jgi:hypothetical protein
MIPLNLPPFLLRTRICFYGTICFVSFTEINFSLRLTGFSIRTDSPAVRGETKDGGLAPPDVAEERRAAADARRVRRADLVRRRHHLLLRHRRVYANVLRIDALTSRTFFVVFALNHTN